MRTLSKVLARPSTERERLSANAMLWLCGLSLYYRVDLGFALTLVVLNWIFKQFKNTCMEVLLAFVSVHRMGSVQTDQKRVCGVPLELMFRGVGELWVLRIGAGFLGRVASALNSRASSSAPYRCFLDISTGDILYCLETFDAVTTGGGGQCHRSLLESDNTKNSHSTPKNYLAQSITPELRKV